MPRVILKVSRVKRIDGKITIQAAGEAVNVSTAEAGRMIAKNQADPAPPVRRSRKKSTK